MARRKKKQDPLDVLMQLGLLAAFFGTFFISKSFIASIVVLLVCIGAWFAILLARKMAADEKLRKSGIADIDRMDGFQFEQYLGQLFKARGYKVQVTQASGDFGADLVIEKEGRKVAIQAKRYSGNVGLKAVQEVAAAKAHYQASEAWVITNSAYTEQAKQLASSNEIKLFSRNDLVEMIVQMNPGSVPSARQVIAEHPAEAKLCERCGKSMVLRKGPKGPFYGCSGYPRCRNIRKA
ncbi:restriction endonuclease [Paenibacillus athensensis]|uniref:Restriction endonuclease n=1 Tax=Paenibacillus athensensis TaxID=1967502 RepID=A0A4Y8PTE9_9BACL|nr:restriction endonuclease [Paenibacillus athensensis]MCD1258001.1 restriction endonuclease [Paenibacillus athensensis]